MQHCIFSEECMDSLDEKVTFVDKPANARHWDTIADDMRRILKERGYQPADSESIRTEKSDTSYNILKPSEKVCVSIRKFLWFSRRELRSACIGSVALAPHENYGSGKEPMNLVFMVYGRTHLPEMEKLANESSRQLALPVSLILETEDCKERRSHCYSLFERYPHESVWASDP